MYIGGKGLVKSIKIMLLGLMIIMLTICIHLFLEELLITDYLALFGMLFVLIGYITNDEKR